MALDGEEGYESQIQAGDSNFTTAHLIHIHSKGNGSQAYINLDTKNALSCLIKYDDGNFESHVEVMNRQINLFTSDSVLLQIDGSIDDILLQSPTVNIAYPGGGGVALFNTNTAQVTLGDLTAHGSSTKLIVNDQGTAVSVEFSGNNFFYLTPSSFDFGDVGQIYPGPRFNMDMFQNMTFFTAGVHQALQIGESFSIQSIIVGDVNNALNANGSYISISNSSSTSNININGNNLALYIQDTRGQFLSHAFARTDYAAAASATISNAPIAGNPSKWLEIYDGGVYRYIPCWGAVAP